MAKSILHKFVSAVADGADATLVRPQSNWDADHDFWLGIRSVTGTTDTIAHSDHFSLITYNNAAAIAVTVPAPSGGNMPSGWETRARNSGAGAVTFTGGGGATINGLASVTLNQNDALELFSNGTPAYQAVITRAAAAASTAPVQFGGSLTYVSTTALKFAPFNGAYIMLNGAQRAIPSGGIAGLTNTAAFVNGVGGSSLVQNTTYYVYVFDNAGTLTADFSTTGHASSATAGNVGTEIKTGDDTRSLIGIIRTDAGTPGIFADSVTKRFVRSWFNKPTVTMGANFTATRATASQTFAEINSEIRLAFVVWATDVVVASTGGGVAAGTAGATCLTGIGWDGAVDANRCIVNSGYFFGAAAITQPKSLTEGYHYVTMMGMSVGGYSTTWGNIGFQFLTAEIAPGA